MRVNLFEIISKTVSVNDQRQKNLRVRKQVAVNNYMYIEKQPR